MQGKGGSCVYCWYNGHGRDAADPANIDFKLKQTEETLIGKYHSAWGQLDCGLLWKTDKATAYSHPGDSVYRKLLGMRRYINTITHKYPDYLLHVTCEIDNPGGDPLCARMWAWRTWATTPSSARSTARKRATTSATCSPRSACSRWKASCPRRGEGGTAKCRGPIRRCGTTSSCWPATPASIPGRATGPPESVAHLRVFNDWRKNPRIKAVLDELLRPVYNGPDWLKNEGPWAGCSPTSSRRRPCSSPSIT